MTLRQGAMMERRQRATVRQAEEIA